MEDIDDHTNGIDTLNEKYIDDVTFRYEDFAKIKEKKDFDVFRAQVCLPHINIKLFLLVEWVNFNIL